MLLVSLQMQNVCSPSCFIAQSINTIGKSIHSKLFSYFEVVRSIIEKLQTSYLPSTMTINGTSTRAVNGYCEIPTAVTPNGKTIKHALNGKTNRLCSKQLTAV